VTLASAQATGLGEAEQEGEIAVKPFELKLLCSLMPFPGGAYLAIGHDPADAGLRDRGAISFARLGMEAAGVITDAGRPLPWRHAQARSAGISCEN